MKIKDKIYIALNKPAGYVSALKDNLHPVISSIIKEDIKGLHIVGRLDKDTTGLIILTNDGAYTHRATHPKKHVEKTYKVTSKEPLADNLKEIFEGGMSIDHGKTPLKPAKYEKLSDYECLLTITEGKFHQVKKMFFAVDNEVLKLHRTSFDNIELDDLNIQIGEYKFIKI